MYFDKDKGEHGGYRRLKGNNVGPYVVVGNTTPIDVNVADGDITLNASDIQIGAVELKDGETENRLTIEVDGIKYALYVQSESLAQESTLTSIAGTDFATETTLGGVALESGGNLDTIAGKDFATEATLDKLVDGTTGLAGGENHIGEVGGSSKIVSPTITVDTDAYEAGDCVGGKITLTDAMRVSGGSGVLQSLTVIDASNTKPYLEVLIFNDDPTAATLTDQAAIALSTDVSKVIHRIPIYTSDYTTVAGVAMADINISKVVEAVGSKNLYACIVSLKVIVIILFGGMPVVPFVGSMLVMAGTRFTALSKTTIRLVFIITIIILPVMILILVL